MEVLFLVILFVLGACFGSFLCCEARRLHYRATSKKKLGSRSICLECKYQLKWYDNIPIISWLLLRGKCRKCGKKIGLAEFLAELGTALALVMLGTTLNLASSTPLEYVTFIATVIFALTLIFLAIYDGLYGELPTACLITAIVFAIVVLVLKEIQLATAFSPELIWKPLLSILILGGLYLILYLVSKGKWVGDGDWLLGTAIAIALFDPWLALIALFLSNILACLVMAPFVIKRKNSKIYFGPFMVIAFIVVSTFATFFQNMI